MVKIEELPVASSGRIKREDCHPTKLDSRFSKWQVLVGPSDWEDHSLGKEGASRYRVHNLPCDLGPGLYELGIAIPPSSSGSKDREVDLNGVKVVYLGHAENIRSRLQNYGRSGAHLGNGCSSEGKCCAERGPGLFEEIFKKGVSIVYRWAPARDKRTAETTEAKMLDQFDYAWNKCSNGSRRPSDINASATKGCSNTSNKLLPITQGRVGAKIEPSKLLPSNLRNYLADEGVEYFLPSVFKFNRSQPIQIERFGINVELGNQCGYISNGVPCRSPPVPGRKRCHEHKGKRICGSKNKPTAEVNGRHDHGYLECNGKKSKEKQHIPLKQKAEAKLPLVLISPDAEVKCTPNPFSFQKPRFSWSKSEEKNSSIISEYETSGGCTTDYTCPRINTGSTSQSSRRSSAAADLLPTCGATVGNGSFCRRPPVQGNKRCWQHKGMRASSTMYYGCDSSYSSYRFGTVTCGAALRNGFCMRDPAPGRKRCEEHKGMRAG